MIHINYMIIINGRVYPFYTLENSSGIFASILMFVIIQNQFKIF